MTAVTLLIKDGEGILEMEGRLDNPEAINEAPTPALVVGSYLAANTEQVVKDAMTWFKTQTVAP